MCRPLSLWLLYTILCWVPTGAGADSLAPVFQRVFPTVVIIHGSRGEVAQRALDAGAVIGWIGCGALIRADLVLTAAHVVQGADALTLELSDGRRVPASVLSSDQTADLALVKLATPLEHPVLAVLGDSDRMRIGDEVFVIGAPLGLGYTLTAGHLSARYFPRDPSMEFKRAEFFQTDAAINHGNSGGPLFNLQGQVVGIVSYIRSTTGANVGLGFAVTSNSARNLMLEQPPFYDGLEAVVLVGDVAHAFNLPQDTGVLVQRVARGSFSARLGLRGGWIPARIDGQDLLLGGDVLLAIDGVKVDTAAFRQVIRARIAGKKPGDAIRVEVLRAGRLVVLSALVE